MEIIELTLKNIPKIGNILYKIREDRDVMQKELAELMGKSQTQVSIMEHSSKTPGLKSLLLYLKALKCKLVIIMDKNEPEQ